jgi:hypothetical protein
MLCRTLRFGSLTAFQYEDLLILSITGKVATKSHSRSECPIVIVNAWGIVTSFEKLKCGLSVLVTVCGNETDG